MSELIASFNNLSDFFTNILEDGQSLYGANGIPDRQTIFVHSALSAFGYVPGGERTVVRALEAVRRKNKLTIVMPAHQDSGENDPESAFADLVGDITEDEFTTNRATNRSEDRDDADNKTIPLYDGATSRLRPGMVKDQAGETLAQKGDMADCVQNERLEAGRETNRLSGERFDAGQDERATIKASGERIYSERITMPPRTKTEQTERINFRSGESGKPASDCEESGKTGYDSAGNAVTHLFHGTSGHGAYRRSDSVEAANEKSTPTKTQPPARVKNRWPANRYPVDPQKIPCLGMGRIADEFRRTRGVRRSDHPTLSFCAKGPLARDILSGHRRATGLGPASPLGELYRRDALVLMLGTDWRTCTALHLAEYEIARRIEAAGGTVDRVTCRARSGRHGKWEIWEDIAYRTDLFPEIGRAFETAEGSRIRRGTIAARGRVWRLFRIRDIVEFSIDRYGVLR